MTQIYTGDGKGKTTAAIGLAMRAAGHGLRSRIIQFMKGETTSGEIEALREISAIDIERVGANFIAAKQTDANAVAASLRPALDAAGSALVAHYDLVILDEIITAVSLGVLPESEVLRLIEARDPKTELILTGRGASQAVIDAADLVTEMRDIKHPYDKGIHARAGIEF